MNDAILSTVDYTQLNKIQKLALFMIVVGPEPAGELLRYFDDNDIELICREIANFRIVSRELQEQVLNEFADIIGESIGAILGGSHFAQKALELAKGEFKAANLLGRISPVGSSLEVIKEISEMEPRQIYNLIRYEQPQTIAFVISYLQLDKSSAVINMFPPEAKEEIVERIGRMEDTNLEHVGKVVASLRSHFNIKQKPSMHRSGGVRTVADLLNLMDKDASRLILSSLEQRNPQLGSQIRRKMFSFEDLSRLALADLQRVMREVDMNDLTIALKSANGQMQQIIYSAVSKRAAESLKEEMSMMGPVRLKEVEAAQDRIIQVVRRLEEEGEIALDNGNSSDRVLV